MKILLTNDDGMHAPGLAAMHDGLDGLGEIFTVAPLTVQSATGHGITFTEPLMVESVEFRPGVMGLAVDGRPAVIDGLREFREHLGGELTITLIEAIGRGLEVHSIDIRHMLEALDWLRDRASGGGAMEDDALRNEVTAL